MMAAGASGGIGGGRGEQTSTAYYKDVGPGDAIQRTSIEGDTEPLARSEDLGAGTCISERGVRRTAQHRWSRGVAGGSAGADRGTRPCCRLNSGGAEGCNTNRNKGGIGGSSSGTRPGCRSISAGGEGGQNEAIRVHRMGHFVLQQLQCI